MTEHSQHDHQAHEPAAPPPRLEKDPVCGMTVPADAPLRTMFEGRPYVFCGTHCLERFRSGPRHFVEAERPKETAASPSASQVAPAPAPATQWTCPMHPQIVRDEPGNCPICGMALEPKTVTLDEAASPELRDMRRRFWVCAALSVPLMAIAMAHMLPFGFVHRLVASPARPWIELALASPVVLWGSWPFFRRAVESVRLRSLNMFTLIGLGVAVVVLLVAFGSVIAMCASRPVGSSAAVRTGLCSSGPSPADEAGRPCEPFTSLASSGMTSMR